MNDLHLLEYFKAILPEWHLTLVPEEIISRPMIIFCKNHNQPNCITGAMFIDGFNVKGQINLDEIDFTTDQTARDTLNQHLLSIKTNYYSPLCKH